MSDLFPGLTDDEVEVEYLVRGLASNGPAAFVKMRSSLAKEKQTPELKVFMSHVDVSKIDEELEHCGNTISKIVEIIDFFDVKNFTIEIFEKFNTRLQHYEDRIRRLIDLETEKDNIDRLMLLIKKGRNSLIKYYSDVISVGQSGSLEKNNKSTNISSSHENNSIMQKIDVIDIDSQSLDNNGRNDSNEPHNEVVINEESNKSIERNCVPLTCQVPVTSEQTLYPDAMQYQSRHQGVPPQSFYSHGFTTQNTASNFQQGSSSSYFPLYSGSAYNNNIYTTASPYHNYIPQLYPGHHINTNCEKNNIPQGNFMNHVNSINTQRSVRHTSINTVQSNMLPTSKHVNFNSIVHSNEPNSESESDSVCSNNNTQENSQSNHNTTPNYKKFSNRYIPNWKIAFDGTEKGLDVNDFIFRLEMLAQRDHYPLEDLPSLLPRLLADTAEKWFWIYIRKVPAASWYEIKKSLMERFSCHETERATKRFIETKRQRTRESFNDFLLEIEALNSRLQTGFAEKELLEIIRENMDPALRNATITMKFNSLEDLRVMCQKLEKLWSQSGHDPRQLNTIQASRRHQIINELDYNMAYSNNCNFNQGKLSEISNNYDQNYDEQLGAINNANLNDNVSILRNNKTINKNIPDVCWNCHDIGHRYQECNVPITKIFCFGCGRPNILKPHCINCLRKIPGNRFPSVVHSGEMHSGNSNKPGNFFNNPKQ